MITKMILGSSLLAVVFFGTPSEGAGQDDERVSAAAAAVRIVIDTLALDMSRGTGFVVESPHTAAPILHRGNLQSFGPSQALRASQALGFELLQDAECPRVCSSLKVGDVAFTIQTVQERGAPAGTERLRVVAVRRESVDHVSMVGLELSLVREEGTWRLNSIDAVVHG